MDKNINITISGGEAVAVLESLLRELIDRGLVSNDVVGLIMVRKKIAASVASKISFINQSERVAILLSIKKNAIKNGLVDKSEFLDDCMKIKPEMTADEFEEVYNQLYQIYNSSEESIQGALILK